ncbi:MAG: EF-P beta-lysylation protein EpmB, partial [Planctomycetaceae bacterium]
MPTPSGLRATPDTPVTAPPGTGSPASNPPGNASPGNSSPDRSPPVSGSPLGVPQLAEPPGDAPHGDDTHGDDLQGADRQGPDPHGADPRTVGEVLQLPWTRQLAAAIRDVGELAQWLQLPESWVEPARRASQLFPLVVPHSFLARIRPGDPHDPLLAQVLPVEAEWSTPPGFTADPLAESDAQPLPGLLHKYRGRVLLIAAGACAIHCRYCFRRHFPYDAAPRSPAHWQPALDYIAQDPSLEEVLLSGGDPLVLSDNRLGWLLEELGRIPHLQRIRLHTRLPIVLPARVNDTLLDQLTSLTQQVVVVVHANHPQEIAADVPPALRRLVQAGLTVLNQSVLLAGVNDSTAVLTELSRRLIRLGVLPYYLHQLDRVLGTAHFEVPP